MDKRVLHAENGADGWLPYALIRRVDFLELVVHHARESFTDVREVRHMQTVHVAIEIPHVRRAAA